MTWDFNQYSKPTFDEYYEEQISRFKHILKETMQCRGINWKQALTMLYQEEEDDYEDFDLENDPFSYQKLEHFLYKWDLPGEKIDDICEKFFFRA